MEEVQKCQNATHSRRGGECAQPFCLMGSNMTRGKCVYDRLDELGLNIITQHGSPVYFQLMFRY